MTIAVDLGRKATKQTKKKLVKYSNGGHHRLNRSQNFDFQIALSNSLSDFDRGFGRLHGLIRACI